MNLHLIKRALERETCKICKKQTSVKISGKTFEFEGTCCDVFKKELEKKVELLIHNEFQKLIK